MFKKYRDAYNNKVKERKGLLDKLPLELLYRIYDHIEPKDKLKFLLLSRSIFEIVMPKQYIELNSDLALRKVNWRKFGRYVKKFTFIKPNARDAEFYVNVIKKYFNHNCEIYIKEANKFKFSQLLALSEFKIMELGVGNGSKLEVELFLWDLSKFDVLFKNINSIIIKQDISKFCPALLECFPVNIKPASGIPEEDNTILTDDLLTGLQWN